MTYIFDAILVGYIQLSEMDRRRVGLLDNPSNIPWSMKHFGFYGGYFVHNTDRIQACLLGAMSSFVGNHNCGR